MNKQKKTVNLSNYFKSKEYQEKKDKNKDIEINQEKEKKLFKIKIFVIIIAFLILAAIIFYGINKNVINPFSNANNIFIPNE